MWSTILPLVAFGCQLVSAATILENIKKVDSSVGALGDTVVAYKGGLLGAVPILEKSVNLLIDINKGTKDTENSAPLTLDEAFGVASATIDLVATVNSTLQAVIDRKPDFDKLLVISPIILGNLELQKSATDKFSAAIVEKVPVEAQPIAEELIAEIEASFEAALDAYKLF